MPVICWDSNRAAAAQVFRRAADEGQTLGAEGRRARRVRALAVAGKRDKSRQLELLLNIHVSCWSQILYTTYLPGVDGGGKRGNLSIFLFNDEERRWRRKNEQL